MCLKSWGHSFRHNFPRCLKFPPEPFGFLWVHRGLIRRRATSKLDRFWSDPKNDRARLRATQVPSSSSDKGSRRADTSTALTATDSRVRLATISNDDDHGSQQQSVNTSLRFLQSKSPPGSRPSRVCLSPGLPAGRMAK